jgi:hypothetical protein
MRIYSIFQLIPKMRVNICPEASGNLITGQLKLEKAVL